MHQFSRMQHFTRRIKVIDSFLGFYFNRLFTKDGLRYHISVIGKDKKTYIFYMDQGEGGSWHLVDRKKCPHWIVESEGLLSEAIKDHLAEGS